jgi:predicted peptidase
MNLSSKSFFAVLAIWIVCAVHPNDHIAAVQPPEDWQESFTSESTSSDGNTLEYRLFSPEAASSDNRLPLVLFLHGAGERGDDNTAQLKHGVVEFFKRQQQHPCYILAPQCPKDERWVDVDWNRETGRGAFEESPSTWMRLALMSVQSLVDSGKVDPDRIYVTGLSMGGYGTWYAAGMKETPFAAAAPICGGGDPMWAQRYVDLPLWVFHGDADNAVPVDRSREMVKSITKAGGNPIYTEYPGVGHDSWTETYANGLFHDWLMSQSK